jgi:hypothetical protein
MLFDLLPPPSELFDFSALTDDALLKRWRLYTQTNTRQWRDEDKRKHWFEEECMWLEIIRRGVRP